MRPKQETIDIVKALEQEIISFSPRMGAETVGEIMQVGDGIAVVSGLSKVRMGELVLLPKKLVGLALNLNSDSVGVIVLGDDSQLKEGDVVKTTGRLLSVGVGEALLGRVVNPLGEALDGKGDIGYKKFFPLERLAPGVVEREPVITPLQTGIISIDSTIPIGRGQRELIIGDRGTGKSAIALTTIINQRKSGVKCIYVVIGQKRSFVAQILVTLEKFKALDHTILVAATASDPASFQYLAPYAGCAIGEYFAQKGEDALIIYDDLTKHAWAYRQISLLIRRPSGREAYPGDVFYLHSRLLERAVKFNKKNGGGSLTALPIIETQAGDLSSYIPTNVISITDGQIYLETDLFNAGIRPAINVGASVSRVGSSAQIKAMKQVAGTLRLDLAQYRELAAFAQFSTDLDKATKARLDRGRRISEILKQGWDKPMAVAEQVMIMWAVNHGYIDQVAVENVKGWQEEYLRFLTTSHVKIGQDIVKEQKITDQIEKDLIKVTENFNRQHQAFLTKELAEVTG
ncbi:F0F1 ATP synthase subunit alpha [Microgenomates group bacterium RIFCSPLOWO2_01_FULL_46_13]|nr:MAG: F0F1 ATP synthase subunit alpha [Microgenomates group bacterium RIFCSPHIGHO2_01_FULL_45_11]OGV94675.1 MAG: F0F1 ATP synthase subunit alpha [Microgenomates group bacterium RIFCSPLOWO2_01_FULL_46_13]